MKKVIITTISVSLFLSSLMAQKTKVTEGNEKFSSGSHNALSVIISEVNSDLVEREWKSLMKRYNAKISSAKNELFADNALIKAMGNNTIDVYTKIEKNGENNTRLMVAFDLGGAYLSSSEHGSQYKEAKKIIYEFAVNLSKQALEERIKAAEKVYDKTEKKQNQLVKDNEGFHKDIENYKERIKKAESDIDQNSKDQELTKKEMETQKKAVDELRIKLDKVD